jgi:hypothetical protein
MASEPVGDPTGWGAGLDSDELAQMQRTPSVVVNRVYVRPYGTMVRISLGEVIEGKTNWHGAMMVSAQDLIPIAELCLTQANWVMNSSVNQAVPAPQEPDDAE